MANLYNKKPLTRDQLKLAKENSKSALGAARLLKVSYNTFVKYAKRYEMLEEFKNQAGVGIPKHYNLHSGKYNLDDILEGKYPKYDTYKLQQRLIRVAYIPEECDCCGFNEQRITDKKVPLKIDFVDGDTTNHLRENIRLLCYNCWFFNVGNLSGRKAESAILKKEEGLGTTINDEGDISIEDIIKEIDNDKEDK